MNEEIRLSGSMATVGQSVGVEVVGGDVAEGVDGDAGHAQAVPVGPQAGDVAVGAGVGRGGGGRRGSPGSGCPMCRCR